jgi:arsenate reductase-like glutaredoxin family protein
VKPDCSKCRSAVAILAEHHVEAEHVRYLDTPPTVAELEHLMGLLGMDDPRNQRAATGRSAKTDPMSTGSMRCGATHGVCFRSAPSWPRSPR